MNLPRLYKFTKTKAIQICDISVSGAVVSTTFGQLDGKLQTSTDPCSPKNTGRSNATTAEQQAILEAQSKFAKKVKSGYSQELTSTPTVQLPQKVKTYQDNKHLVSYPCYATPKYNGLNGTYWLLPDKTLKLTSRGGDELPPIPHLEPTILKMMELFKTTCINGELYISGESLQNITSAVKKPKELSKSLEFIPFELPLVSAPYKDKVALLIKYIPIVYITREEMLEEFYAATVGAGYEGVVIYNTDSIYQFNQRSSTVLKYKPVADAEYKILSYTADRNGHPVFTCETHDGKQFKVKPKGTDEERKQIITNFDSQYKNNYYKIEYEMLSDSGIPLKGVGIGLRACDSNAEPLE